MYAVALLRGVDSSLRRTTRLLVAGVGLLGLVAAAQAQIPTKGDTTTFDIGTWNIETLGGFPGFGPDDEALQFRNVREVMAHAGIDLWAVQEMGPDSCLPEITDKNCFEILVDSLDGYDGRLATNLGPNGFVRVGFIFDTTVVRLRSVRHILSTGSNPEQFRDRPPLRLDVDVTLKGHTERLIFITLHLWPGTGAAEYARRSAAGFLLRDYIDTRLPNDKVVVLGDFNDELTTSIRAGQPSPFAAWVADTTYRFLTVPLEERGEGSFIPRGSSIDHIVITEELAPGYVEGSAEVFGELVGTVTDYGNTTSDHLPVLARFDWERLVVSVESETTAPEMFALHANYPNPFNPATVIPFETTAPAEVYLRIVDLLGRPVATLVSGNLPAGRHAARWQADAVAAGTYVARLRVDGEVRTRLLTLMK